MSFLSTPLLHRRPPWKTRRETSPRLPSPRRFALRYGPVPRQCTLPPIKTVDSIGVYDLEGTTFTEALVDLYFDPGNNLTNTIINLNPGTNKTLSVTKSDTSPVIDIYRQTAPTNPGNDPEGKTQINGKLNLRINASETDTNDTQVIELIVGNHTLSFSDDVVVSSEVTSQGRRTTVVTFRQKTAEPLS